MGNGYLSHSLYPNRCCWFCMFWHLVLVWRMQYKNGGHCQLQHVETTNNDQGLFASSSTPPRKMLSCLGTVVRCFGGISAEEVFLTLADL